MKVKDAHPAGVHLDEKVVHMPPGFVQPSVDPRRPQESAGNTSSKSPGQPRVVLGIKTSSSEIAWFDTVDRKANGGVQGSRERFETRFFARVSLEFRSDRNGKVGYVQIDLLETLFRGRQSRRSRRSGDGTGIAADRGGDQSGQAAAQVGGRAGGAANRRGERNETPQAAAPARLGTMGAGAAGLNLAIDRSPTQVARTRRFVFPFFHRFYDFDTCII